MEELHSLSAHYFISPAVEKLGSSKWKEEKKQTISIVATMRVLNNLKKSI